MRFHRPLLAVLFLAFAVPTAEAQRADAIARLEAARDADPRNVAALRSLGVAYYKAERFGDARSVLNQARQMDPTDGVIALYAGLSAEQLQDYTNARAAYNSYLEVGKSRRVRNQIRQRLVTLARAEAVAAAKAAVANEATLSQTPGDRRTIAVPPLRFSGPDAEILAPLERGLADLIITDLSRSSQLTIVERDRMQALADEIRLGESGRVDAGTAVRAGRLIQAGRLINGSIVQGGSQLTISTSVVDVESSEISAPVQVTDELDDIFTMQKELVLQIFDQLDVTLTPAERQLVDRQSTTNLNALLAYGRGLQAADDGRFEDATRFFDDARTIDPGFGAAAANFQSAQSAAAGVEVSSASIESNLTGAESRAVSAAEDGNFSSVSLGNTLTNVAQDVNAPSVTPESNNADRRSNQVTPAPVRDATTSTTAIDPPPTTRQGSVSVIIRRP